MARDLKKKCVTSCPTYGLWFERFVIRMHKRMNDEVHQDQAVTLGVVHQLIEGLERDFIASKIEEEKDSLTDQAIFTLEDFLAALREEEVLKLVRGETRTYFAEARRNTKLPHVVLPLLHRYKHSSQPLGRLH